MPLTYQFDPTRRLVTCTGQGAVTGEEVAALVTALRATPGFDASCRQFWDLAGVTQIPIAFQDMMWLTGAEIFSSDTKRAYFAPADAVFGTARMLAMVQEAKGEKGSQVFRERAAALAWLGLCELSSTVREPRADSLAQAV